MKLFSVLLPILLTSWLNVACSSTTATPAPNTAPPQAATTAYEPVRGQAGKDVIWIPTPEGLIDKMLTAAKVTDQDRLFDLGAGDGIIAITAARKYGARSVGIEYNPDMAQFARRKVAEAGMTDKVRIITGDIFQEDFSSATVVTLYLMPHLNLKLRPILLKMKPGTRVVSHAFNMGDWGPDETMSDQFSQGFFWVVPAQIEGDWVMTGLDGGPTRLNMSQSFQNIGGILTRGGQTQALMGAKLRGDEVKFQFITPDKKVHTFSGRVEDRRITGTVVSDYMQTPVEITRP
ncbi:cyclopropane-fatty-acyl-phospholipid synthase family protein [Limnohabitans sp. 2KL-51]|uniref:SAM-dependent methyltransferase n=1 Tax=Limnohabitans sp. 2KL-51 TaxID=1977911 RepID=UPI000D3DA0E3|nr:class I SAM-dependent methyltransferase [Limnohabitans sp. 2KL-51]PUE48782.1 SAM-dependent methyltransferase [Limnohabitans sp. 2KL-51]